MKTYALFCALLSLPLFGAMILKDNVASVDKAPTLVPDTKSALASKTQEAGLIQLALVLDNSGSMSGLLNQARSELWSVVNALDGAKQHRKQVKIEVSLYEYGGPPAKELMPFTGDLDAVSEALFAMGISGGSEYAGEAIAIATKNLKWSDDPNALKLLFIAGNEPFTQGPVHYSESIAQAREKGVIVSTIHCGGTPDKDWRAGASLGAGTAASIDHNAVVAVTTPYDQQLTALSAKLNTTYIPYGKLGQKNALRQRRQDSNSSSINIGSAVRRAVSKSSHNYSNASWDLVDGAKQKDFKIAQIDKKTLPKALHAKSDKELELYVQQTAQKRRSLQKQIAELNKKREAYIATQNSGGDHTLSAALIETIRTAGSRVGITGI